MPNFIEQFKKEIEGFRSLRPRPAHTGTVVRVGDGVAEIEGLAGAAMSEMVRFDTSSRQNAAKRRLRCRPKSSASILNLEEESVRAIILGDVGAGAPRA